MDGYREESEMTMQEPKVAVLMGSTSDAGVMEGCRELLRVLGIPHEIKVLSAHRTPDQTRDYVTSAADKGIEIIIAAAGWAAHLAGVAASHTTLPVIGVPIDSSPLQGMDALLATVQMPPGIPVATMAVGSGGAKNAAILAAQILGLKYPSIAQKVWAYREAMTREALKKGSDFESGA
jgi:phosphoribosylaminoimidazole carboxylase PurE protein